MSSRRPHRDPSLRSAIPFRYNGGRCQNSLNLVGPSFRAVVGDSPQPRSNPSRISMTAPPQDLGQPVAPERGPGRELQSRALVPAGSRRKPVKSVQPVIRRWRFWLQLPSRAVPWRDSRWPVAGLHGDRPRAARGTSLRDALAGRHTAVFHIGRFHFTFELRSEHEKPAIARGDRRASTSFELYFR